METITQSDAAGRLTLVHHKKLPGTTLLKLEYAYTDNSLVETITESDAGGAVADVTFGYDHRGRLISEQRVDYVEPGRSYHLEYEYDQGGNRTKKTDLTNSPNKIEVEYEYDVHPPEPPDPNPYTTFNNRLMKYKTYSVTPAQQEMGVLGGGFETLGEGFETLGGVGRRGASCASCNRRPITTTTTRATSSGSSRTRTRATTTRPSAWATRRTPGR